MNIRVAYIGNYIVDYTTESHVAYALEQLGCEVHRIPQSDADAHVIRGLHADLVLYTRTHNVTALDVRWTDMWRMFEQHGTITASLHLDRFFDLDRERLLYDADPLFTTQHVFTADGGNQDRFAAAGVNHHWLPPAVHAPDVRRHERNRRLTFDVVFVGSPGRMYHDEYPQRGELLEFLVSRYGRRFRRFGAGTTVVRGEQLGQLYESAKVIVGDSCFANSSDPTLAANYWSDRVPETLGRGGLLVHPWVDGMEGFHVDGEHLVTYAPGDWRHLGDAIDWLLVNPERRDEVRLAGQEHVRAHHTYTHRMATLLHRVGLRECPTIDCEEEAAA